MNGQLSLLLISPDIKARRNLIEHISNLQLFAIDTAFDSAEAIAKLKQNEYHFIISDIHIGEVDAWCLSSLIRSDIYKCDRKTPIVLLADTYSEKIAEATAKSFGINAVLAKSDTGQVNEILADALSSSLPLSDRLHGLVIVTDDDINDAFYRIVKDRFYIERATSAKEGLALVRQKQFDFVIIDSTLENESALPLLKTTLHEQPDLPAVILIPKGRSDEAEVFMLQGAADFIYVPYNATRVINICERAARRNDFKISNEQFSNKVNQLEQSHLEYKELSQAHSQLLSNISSIVVELNQAGEIKFLNRAWEQITGFDMDMALNRNLLDFIDLNGLGGAKFSRHFDELLLQHVPSSCEEAQLKTSTGESIWVEISFRQLLRDGMVHGLAATIDNINDRKKAEAKLQHLALHDTLTGLYNRYYFDTELNRLTLLAARGKENHCLLYIDLDHFKIINDTEGHQMGDMVLKEVSQILKKRLRNSDILCRVGGDEFVILLPETSIHDAEEIGASICRQIADAHFQFGNNSYKVSASIGVSEIDGNATAPEYLRQADIALYVAKNKGRNRTHSYTEDDVASKQQHDNLKWAHRLQEAVVNDNIVLHFQPIWDLRHDKIAYYEALVRLNINTKLVYPNDFIPALEKSEDITLLDHQVISKAIKMICDNPILNKVAINLSAQAFSDEALVPLVEEKLAQYQVSGEQIIFELTESASLTNVSGTKRMIDRLSELGCQFSIDDFGTGFSTFAYLKELPAESVKIDGSFVKDIATNPVDKALVTSIRDISSALNKKCVAEFVEDAGALETLRQLNIEFAQGYYISKPMAVEQLKDFNFFPEPEAEILHKKGA